MEKYCRYCETFHPMDRFYKLKAKCKDCLAADKRRVNKGILLDKEKPLSKDCRCGNKRGEVEFHPKKNTCMPCHRQYMEEYRHKNKAKISKQVGDWKKEHRDEVNESARTIYATEEGKALHRARVVKTWRSWMSHIISALEAHAKKPGKHDPKSGPKRDFDINLDYVVDLIEKQDEKCAVTGLPMVREYNSMYAASIDRIDSEQGHIKGNIQIICQAVNWAKRHHPNEEILKFFEDYFKLMVGSDNVLEYIRGAGSGRYAQLHPKPYNVHPSPPPGFHN